MNSYQHVGVKVSIDLLAVAAEEAGCTRHDIQERLEAMYESNLHEDLKWVVSDIQEAGV